MAYLLVVKGANPKETIPLEKDRILIGRKETCDIVLPANDFAVSRALLLVRTRLFSPCGWPALSNARAAPPPLTLCLGR